MYIIYVLITLFENGIVYYAMTYSLEDISI